MYDFLDIWIDENKLLIGENLPNELSSSIKNADYVVLFLSRDSIGSDWVSKEIELSIEKEKLLDRPFLLPILIDECQIPAALKDRLYLKLNSQTEDDVIFLSEQLKQQLFKLVIKYGYSAEQKNNNIIEMERNDNTIEVEGNSLGEKLNGAINAYGTLINNFTEQIKKNYMDIINSNIQIRPPIILLLLKDEAENTFAEYEEFQNRKKLSNDKDDNDKDDNDKDDNEISSVLSLSRDTLFDTKKNIAEKILSKLDFISKNKHIISEEESLFIIKNFIDNL